MGPYVAGNTMLVGFFAFAALHYGYLWCFSRKDSVLSVFSLFCLTQAAASTQIVAMAVATTVEATQTAFDWHLTFALLCLTASVWVVSFATGVTARWFVIPVTIWQLLLIVISLSTWHPNGLVTDIAQLDLSWGERLVSFRHTSPAAWYTVFSFPPAIAIVGYGFIAASILWRRDRLGGLLIGLGTMANVIAVATAVFVVRGDVSLPFVGAGPSAIFVLFVSLQLSRQYARRSEQFDAAQRRFRAIFDQTFQFIGLMKTDGTIFEANRAALEFAGISEEEVLGKRFWDTRWWNHSPELQQRLREGVQKAAGGEIVRFEATFPGKDGQIHLIDFSLKPVRDEVGNVALLVPEGRDITQLKHDEETIRHILAGIAPTTGQSFFLVLANHLSRACHVKYAFVGSLDPSDTNFVQSIAASHCGETVENFSYCLDKTPCNNVVCQEFCYHDTGIQREFPEDELLAQMGIDSYMGIPLKSSTGQPLGLIALLHDQPMAQPLQAETILRVVAARAAAELEREMSEVGRREVERNLKESETFLRLAQEAAKVGSWEWDLSTNRFKWSDELARMHGISAAEFDGTWEMILSFCHPEDIQELQRTMSAAMAGEEIDSFEYRIVRQDGIERNLWFLGHLQRDERGVTVKVLGVAIDITERKRIEQELYESNQFNSQIIGCMPNGLIVVDHDMRYRVWNTRMEEMSGFSAAEVLGKRPLDLFPFLRSTEVPGQLLRALTGETITSSDFPFNIPESGRNGWCSQVMGPLRNSRNEIVGVLVNATDITTRKDTESQLLEAIRSKEVLLALLDTLQAAAPIGLAFVDRDYRFVRCNDALAEINGVPSAGHIGRLVSEVVPDLWPHLEPDYRSILSGQEQGVIREISGETAARPGENRSWIVSYYPVKTQDEIIGVGVIVTDDTERRKADIALRTSEERFRLLFEGAQDAIFWADANTGILTHCNAAAELLLGRNRAEIIGQPQSFLHPSEEANRYRELFQAFAKTERKTNPEADVLRKDGQRVTVSIASSVTMIGGQRIIQGIFRDITLRKQVEETLQMMRFSVDHAGDSVFWISRAGRILYANIAACTDRGYSQDELLGMTISDLDVEPEYQPGTWEKHFDEIKRRGTITFESRHRAKDGRIFPVEVNANYVHIGDKEFNFAFLRDISERKRIDEELRESRQRLEFLSRQLITTQETERRHLARELHDEIGQILTAIKINLHRTKRIADPSLQSNLDDVVGIVDQAIGQVRNLALRLRPAQLDELGLIAALHWLVKHQADLGGIEGDFEVDIGNYHISPAEENVCFRITQEALTNAIRHGKPTKVQVTLRTLDNKLMLSIHDNGIGFDVSESRRRALAGSSFGLISIQERASLAGGSAEIESNPGQGTTVHAWFPLSM